MRNVASGLAAMTASLLLAGCSAGGGAHGFLLPSSFLNLAPRADAVVLLDQDSAARTTRTVPGGARKVRLIVRDTPGHIVGGLIFSNIPTDNTINIPGLPAGVQLRFDATIADQQTVEVGRGKVKQSLAANVANSIPIPIFMNAGDLSAGNTNSTAQTSNVNRISTRVTFNSGDRFRVRPVVSALNAGGSAVACSPAYVIRSGYETEDDHGINTVNTSMFALDTSAGIYNVEVDFTPNCGAGAAQITRKVEFEKLATVVVPVN